MGGERDIVLHVARVKGAASAGALASALGLQSVHRQLAELVAMGLVSHHGDGEGALIAPTEAGVAHPRGLLESELAGGRRDRLGELYEQSFMPLNVEFKVLCATWQTEGGSFELLEALLGVHERITEFLDAASALARRLERYSERLGAAAERVQDGASDALTGPIGESYHNIWFELHEDLLLTLGRSRAEEEA